MLVAQFASLLAPAGSLPGWVGTGLFANLVCFLAVVLLVDRGRTHPAERAWVVPICLGICLFFVGVDLYLLLSATGGGDSSPALTQIAYLAVYPCLLAGILLALRQHLRHARLIVSLDGLTGALAGAALAAYAITPLTERVFDGSAESVFSLSLVFGDVVLFAASLGALSMVGMRHGRNFAVVALGMLVFTVGDIIYAYLLAYDGYQVGTWLDSLWLIGLALMAVGTATESVPPPRNVPPARSLAVVTFASLTAVTVLALAPGSSTNKVAWTLALCTLAGCGVRFGLAFLQLRELAVVREQALTDELTGAGNRRTLYLRLDELLAGSGGDSGDAAPERFTLAFVDLDRFKEVNDSLGHAAGDELLQAVASRFAAALDELDTPHLLTRLGGDEFAVVLDEVATPRQALAVAEALNASLREPVEVGLARLHVRASIGLAMAPEHGTTRSDLLFAADAAMYSSKTSGESVSLHSPDGVGDRRTRLAVAEELYTALDKHELTVAYQPICTPDGRLVAAEALVRWDHPERGRLGPADFLETAERYRLTQAIAERVLDVTLSDLARWRTRDPQLTASVNVSASDLGDESIVAIVANALITHGLPPQALTIEITETAMMRDPEMAHTVVLAFADLGVELAVDDYGTGYSSLEYLLKLPVKEIKLDRAFSTNLGDEYSVAIVRSTIELTHALGLRMVAEGVENLASLEVLRALGCDRVQGWHLGRPMPAGEFENLVGLATDHPDDHPDDQPTRLVPTGVHGRQRVDRTKRGKHQRDGSRHR